MQIEDVTRNSAGNKDGFLPGFDGVCGGLNVPLQNIKKPPTNPDVPLFSPASFWQPLSGLMALDVFAVPIIIVGDAQGLLLAGLPEVLAELGPLEPIGLDLAVAASQVLEGAASQADLGFLKESVAPAAELPELRKDEASFPKDQAQGLERREGREGQQCEPSLLGLLFYHWPLELRELHKYLSSECMKEGRKEGRR